MVGSINMTKKLIQFLIDSGARPVRIPDGDLPPNFMEEDIFAPLNRLAARNKWWKRMPVMPARELTSTLETDSGKFQIYLDVQHFAPEELSVKVVGEYLVIEGCHGEKKDSHGIVARQFIRRYLPPEGCDLDAVESELSSDGVLIVSAPLTCSAANERVVPIKRTGPLKTQPEKLKLVGDGEAAEQPVGDQPVEHLVEHLVEYGQ
ncbi:protein lethal(2)essential for life-like [Ostrinia furnacalis]|uniref:protein lethal(2)essential for life-like n=1 Tax=Ostrinia furnacalis TaxID=93504 RepID=UPI00103EFD85|nr:protein lethal(2)essential for life-like [Ostrinia furnacalis]